MMNTVCSASSDSSRTAGRARARAVVAVIAAVNHSLVAEPLARFGTQAQKETWLRRLACGEALGAFAVGLIAALQQFGFDTASLIAVVVSIVHGLRFL